MKWVNMEQFICLMLKVIIFGRVKKIFFPIFEFVKSLNFILENTMVEMVDPVMMDMSFQTVFR